MTLILLLVAATGQMAALPAAAAAERAAPAASPVSYAGRQDAIRHCYSGTTAVQLTFDDGGAASRTHAILDILRRYNVRAQFFPTGSWAATYPGTMARIRREGHLLGNHTSSHLDLTRISSSAVRAQIRGGVAGTGRPKLLRPPYGAGAFTSRLYDIAASEGYRLCFWTVDTRDWDGSSASTIVRRVRDGDAHTRRVGRGGVVLMHMQGRYTVEALPGVIQAVRAKGLVLPGLPD